MKPQNRHRILWTLCTLVVVYALLNVVVYFATGRFGVAWFVASLVLYGLVLAGTLLLLAKDTRDASPMADAAVAVQVVNVPGVGAAATVGERALVPAPPGTIVESGSTGDPTRRG